MTMFPKNHPERHRLADEVHARPPEPLRPPASASYLAVLVDADARAHERSHVDALFASQGFAVVGPSAPGDAHLRAHRGPLRFKWERHGEFSGYLVIYEGASDAPAASHVPQAWWRAIPGATVAAVHVDIEIRPRPSDPSTLGVWVGKGFEGHTLVASSIAEGAATVCTDFRIHADGCSRFQVFDHGLTPDQAGRTLQRLVEIEAYRMLALLALPIARRQAPRIQQIEQSLARITDGMAGGTGGGESEDEELLHQITKLAAEVESGLAASQFRFGACRAYYELVLRRITELRETRLPGVQTIEEFMARRFTPAVATCHTASQRMQSLSERVARASGLLSTRVDITRERQNQSLLGSMDRRAKLQLRLQQTVEGLSVAAIVYYLSGLVGYLAKGARAVGLPLNADLTVALAVPLLVAAAIWGLRRARRRALGGDDSGQRA